MSEEVNSQITDSVTQTPAPNITIADIAFLVQIVEVCSQRGAFRAEELTNVGAVYDRVKAFIVANTPAPQANDDTTEESE